jgi:hypothetical protein
VQVSHAGLHGRHLLDFRKKPSMQEIQEEGELYAQSMQGDKQSMQLRLVSEKVLPASQVFDVHIPGVL